MSLMIMRSVSPKARGLIKLPVLALSLNRCSRLHFTVASFISGLCILHTTAARDAFIQSGEAHNLITCHSIQSMSEYSL
jgi:putative exporter of polyketide antibiotics